MVIIVFSLSLEGEYIFGMSSATPRQLSVPTSNSFARDGAADANPASAGKGFLRLFLNARNSDDKFTVKRGDGEK